MKIKKNRKKIKILRKLKIEIENFETKKSNVTQVRFEMNFSVFNSLFLFGRSKSMFGNFRILFVFETK